MALLDEVRAVCGRVTRQRPHPTDRTRVRVAVGRRAESLVRPPAAPACEQDGRWRTPT